MISTMRLASVVADLLEDADHFPQESNQASDIEYRVSDLQERFDINEKRLFCNTDDALIYFRYLRFSGKGRSPTLLSDRLPCL